MLRQADESPDKSDDELATRLQEAVALKDTGFFLSEHCLFISVPDWEGWKYISHEKYESVDHFAHWEVFFHPKGERICTFLRISWPSLTQILFRFIYPEDRKILEEITSHRCLGLLDRPLLNGQLNPLSSGIIINDIPTDVLEALGIGINDGTHMLH